MSNAKNQNRRSHPRLFVAKVHQTKTYALVAKINEFGRRCKVHMRLERLPSDIMSAWDDVVGLKNFLIRDGILQTTDRLELKSKVLL